MNHWIDYKFILMIQVNTNIGSNYSASIFGYGFFYAKKQKNNSIKGLFLFPYMVLYIYGREVKM